MRQVRPKKKSQVNYGQIALQLGRFFGLTFFSIEKNKDERSLHLNIFFDLLILILFCSSNAFFLKLLLSVTYSNINSITKYGEFTFHILRALFVIFKHFYYSRNRNVLKNLFSKVYKMEDDLNDNQTISNGIILTMVNLAFPYFLNVLSTNLLLFLDVYGNLLCHAYTGLKLLYLLSELYLIDSFLKIVKHQFYITNEKLRSVYEQENNGLTEEKNNVQVAMAIFSKLHQIAYVSNELFAIPILLNFIEYFIHIILNIHYVAICIKSSLIERNLDVYLTLWTIISIVFLLESIMYFICIWTNVANEVRI